VEYLPAFQARKKLAILSDIVPAAPAVGESTLSGFLAIRPLVPVKHDGITREQSALNLV